MNPIFNRRYKAGGRPNILPTNKRPNFKSMSLSQSNSSTSPGSSSAQTLSDSSVGDEECPTFGDSGESDPSLPSPCSPEPHVPPLFQTSANGFHGNSKISSWKTVASPSGNLGTKSANKPSPSGGKTAQQLFAEKQNMLAQLALTPDENRQRTKLVGRHASQMCHSTSTENFPLGARGRLAQSCSVHDISANTSFGSGRNQNENNQQDMTFTDVEDVGSACWQHNPKDISRMPVPNLNHRISKQAMDLKTWRELKQVVCGSMGFTDGWTSQIFTFDHKIPFGLVQKQGGPCGVLAVVQSHLLRNLLFGSASLSSDDHMGQTIEDYLEGRRGHDDGEECVKQGRLNCLVGALAEIISRCAQSSGNTRASSVIMFSDYRIQPELIRVDGRLELERFIEDNLYRFDCTTLVYSAVLSRGIHEVSKDMDFDNCSLIGQHGYCSQELINLLNLGKAISNTFDDEIELDGKVLKGIGAQCDIGLLSLFEYYDSIKVGKNLKCPRYPIWVVCSESHFSVLFAYDMSLCIENSNMTGAPYAFQLYYYDGLSRQEKIIRLSIRNEPLGCNLSHGGVNNSSFKGSQSSFQAIGSRSSMMSNVDLVPPLEKCIRTKWHDATVDWNDTEPIL